MAFSGLHVAFGYMRQGNRGGNAAPIYGDLAASDTMASAGTSAVAAPSPSNHVAVMASIRAAADSWISIGATPGDPSQTTTPRRFIPANTTVDFFCQPFDKVRWVAA